jgi:hypothetical protein
MVTMELAHMTNNRFTMTILALLILTVAGAPGTQRFFHSTGFLQAEHVAWAQTETEIFPNSTSPAMLGNRSLIPGMHVMSLVHDVKPTWLIISSDTELSVNIRYNGIGNLTAPSVSLLATALKTTSGAPQVPGATFERLTGSNITQGGWTSPMTVPLRLEGTLSLYDADLIVVMIVPYTGLPLANLTTSLLPQQIPN